MQLKIGPLRRRDYRRVIGFAREGMHFERYTRVPWMQMAYGWYFLFLEMNRASELFAAYDGAELVGVLMADMKGRPKACVTPLRRLAVRLLDVLMGMIFRAGPSAYEQANAEMYAEFTEKYTADGELCFLAVDPARQGQGVGSFLLEELIRRQKGKRIFLYTDDNCAYRFYDCRGYECVARRSIVMELGAQRAPLECMLYSRVLE